MPGVTLRTYWTDTRAPRYGVLFAAPLFLVYEASSFLMRPDQGGGVRNGADVLLRTLLGALGGPRGLALFTVLIAGIGLAVVWRDRRRHPGPLQRGAFAGMLAESGLWALLLGGTTAAITSVLLDPLAIQAGAVQSFSLPQRLVLSAGAGLYEEIVFRVVLVGGMTWIGVALGWSRRLAVAVAIVGSALVFSGFHYIGPYGDVFQLGSFTFRAVAGVLLSGLYVARGFGIAVWSHAIYDVLVLT